MAQSWAFEIFACFSVFCRTFLCWFKVLDESDRKTLIENLANHIVNAKEFIQERAVNMFSQVDPDMGRRLDKALKSKR